jgi:very-short-patch-repair endonuclease
VRVTLSRLEARFIRRLKEAGLPLPKTNRVAGERRVDCRWPEHKLTVELDSYRYHHSRYAWEQDRLREREARARGDEFRRYTSRDVFEDPRFMLSELRALLG